MSEGRYRGGPDTATRSQCHDKSPAETSRKRRLRDDVVQGGRHDPRSEDYEEPSTGTARAPAALREAPAEPPGPATASLPPELLQRLEEAQTLHARMASLDHYALLGLASHATPREIRSAYFALSKRFHPDAFFRKDIGSHRARLEGVFDALTRAYDTLRRPGSRTDYDDALKLPQARRYRADASDRPRRRDSVPLPPETESDRVFREVERRVSSAPPAFAPPRPSNQISTKPFAQNSPVTATKPLVPSAPATGTMPRPAPLLPPRANGPITGTTPFAEPPSTRPVTSPEPRVADKPPAPGNGVRPAAPAGRTNSVPPPATEPGSPPAPNPFDDDPKRSTLLRELDQLVKQRLSQPPGARASIPPPDSAPPTGTRPSGATLPLSLLELAEQLRGLGGLRHWASQRLREAHQEEQAGHVVDAVNILRIVLLQLKEPQIEAHVQRLSRQAAQKTVPAQRLRAKGAEQDGHFQEAAELWQRVRDATPDDAQAAYHHARMLMAAGDLKNAGRAAMRASELAPEHVESRELLITFFDRMGMKLNARRERDTVQRLLEARAAQNSRGK